MNLHEKKQIRSLTACVVLSGTAAVAIVTYLREYTITAWLGIVLGSLVGLLIFALIIERMLISFIEANHAKAEEEQAKQILQEEDSEQQEVDHETERGEVPNIKLQQNRGDIK